jgi:tetratricopeptide (TPR) repeat protein
VYLNLLAAEGWIELGNYDEAVEELHNCPVPVKSSVEWVKLWVRIYAATHRWREVEIMCETLAKHAATDPFTIFHQAEAFHRQSRSREAFAVFQMAPLSFKQGAEYFYALSRYLCALDQMTLALSCLGKAFDANPDLRMKALIDPDLERVWLNLQDGEMNTDIDVPFYENQNQLLGSFSRDFCLVFGCDDT